MSALDAFRGELRALLGSDVLLRRDRAMRALFICDAPRRAIDTAALRSSLTAAGYAVTEENGLWRIDLSPPRQTAFIASLSPGPLPAQDTLCSLCRSLLAAGETPPDRQPWPPIRQILIQLDAGEISQLTESLAADIAICKRTHAPLPTAAAYIIENTLAQGGILC